MGAGADTPATPGSGVPRDLFCSLPSASPFLCLAISKVSTLSPCQDLNLLYHSLYALQRACKCPAHLSSPASIPPSFPQRAEGSSHISHADPDPFSKSVPKISQSSGTKLRGKAIAKSQNNSYLPSVGSAYFSQAPLQVMLEPASGGPAAGSLILGSTTPGDQEKPLLCQPSAFQTRHGKQHKYKGSN